MAPRPGIFCTCGRRILASDVLNRDQFDRTSGQTIVCLKLRCPDCGALSEYYIPAEDWSEDLLPEVASIKFDPGDLLRLPKSTAGPAAGWYVLLSLVDAQAMLCYAERDDDGKVTATDRLRTVNIYDRSFFRPTGLRMVMAAPVSFSRLLCGTPVGSRLTASPGIGKNVLVFGTGDNMTLTAVAEHDRDATLITELKYHQVHPMPARWAIRIRR